MRPWCLAAGHLTPVQRGVRDHFTEGGSVLTVAAVAAVCLLAVGVAFWLTRRLAIRSGAAPSGKQLFTSALDLAKLSSPQRKMLTTVASAGGVENPAVLLLSRPVFDHHVDQWLGLKNRATIDDKAKTQIRIARELRAALFPPR